MMDQMRQDASCLSPVEARKVYERVTQTVSIDESSFVMYFNDTINELMGKYRPKYVILPYSVFNDIEAIDDTVNVFGLYTQCIVDNIIYLINGDQNKKSDFINHAEQVYLTVFREINKDIGVNPMSYHTSDGRW